MIRPFSLLPRTRSRRRGANAIEFALTLPVFIIILFGVVDYGWYFMNQAAANGAVFRGCRQGSIADPAMSSAEVAGVNNMQPMMNVVGRDCASVCSAQDVGEVPFRRLNCRVDFPFVALTGLTPVPNRVAASTVSRLEWQRAR